MTCISKFMKNCDKKQYPSALSIIKELQEAKKNPNYDLKNRLYDRLDVLQVLINGLAVPHHREAVSPFGDLVLSYDIETADLFDVLLTEDVKLKADLMNRSDIMEALIAAVSVTKSHEPISDYLEVTDTYLLELKNLIELF